jgi:hypothetical protein
VGPYNGDMTVGDYGVNLTTHTAWVVVDTDGQYAVMPEPSTGILLGIGATSLLAYVRWRRRS